MMNDAVSKKAFVLAAGKGTRMLHLSDECPKPMLKVDNITMLDHALDALQKAGVEEVVVNTFHLAEVIEDHLANRQDLKITISREEELLETAGGVKKAIEFFGDEPFFVLNSDVVWTDNSESTLLSMAKNWDSDKMDLMLLMHPVETAHFYDGEGDYHLDNECGELVFAKDQASNIKPNSVFAGPRIVHPRIFDNVEYGRRSFIELFHTAEKNGRLYGYRHNGEWFHVGTPEALEETNRIFAEKRTGAEIKAKTNSL